MVSIQSLYISARGEGAVYAHIEETFERDDQEKLQEYGGKFDYSLATGLKIYKSKKTLCKFSGPIDSLIVLP